jgi:hypothetical protein
MMLHPKPEKGPRRTVYSRNRYNAGQSRHAQGLQRRNMAINALLTLCRSPGIGQNQQGAGKVAGTLP